MPSQYVVEARGGEVVVVEDGRREAWLAVPLGSDLQAAVDSAFAGQGPPLVPVPLLLRRARTAEEQVQAFRSKLLGPLRIVGCGRVKGEAGEPLDEVALEADNGSLRARFDAARGWLSGLKGSIVMAPGQAPIEVEARYEPRPGIAPPRLPADLGEHARRVTRLADLSGPAAQAPDQALSAATLRRLDGAIVPLLDHPDSVVVIEFWARWCAPCRATLATAARLDRWARAAGLPVRVLLVNTQESFSSGRDARRQIEDYLAKAGNTMQTLLDPESRLHLALGGGLPRTVVIDRSGRVAGSHTGYDPDLGPKLESQILKLTSGGSR